MPHKGGLVSPPSRSCVRTEHKGRGGHRSSQGLGSLLRVEASTNVGSWEVVVGRLVVVRSHVETASCRHGLVFVTGWLSHGNVAPFSASSSVAGTDSWSSRILRVFILLVELDIIVVVIIIIFVEIFKLLFSNFVPLVFLSCLRSSRSLGFGGCFLLSLNLSIGFLFFCCSVVTSPVVGRANGLHWTNSTGHLKLLVENCIRGDFFLECFHCKCAELRVQHSHLDFRGLVVTGGPDLEVDEQAGLVSSTLQSTS